MEVSKTPIIREAVAVFDTESALHEAVGDLLTHGFNRSEISLLASDKAIKRKGGHRYNQVQKIEDDSSVPRTAYAPGWVGDAEGAVIGSLMYVGAFIGLMPVVISGGALAAAVVAATVGGGSGAAIGTLLASVIGNKHSEYIQRQLERGGLLLWVRTWNPGDESRAVKILKSHSGHDVHVHGIPGVVRNNDAHAMHITYRGVAYEKAGPTEFYVSGKLFSSEQEVEVYIDRHTYIEGLYDEARKLKIDLDMALADPISVFQNLENLNATPLSSRLKLELLKRWAYTEKELEIASDDGMRVPPSGDNLQAVEALIKAVEGRHL